MDLAVENVMGGDRWCIKMLSMSLELELSLHEHAFLVTLSCPGTQRYSLTDSVSSYFSMGISVFHILIADI